MFGCVTVFSQELNAVNWLATYLHSNNPNNNLMRKAFHEPDVIDADRVQCG